ncbi:protein of unknown function [Burkholderia multivorans]
MPLSITATRHHQINEIKHFSYLSYPSPEFNSDNS